MLIFNKRQNSLSNTRFTIKQLIFIVQLTLDEPTSSYDGDREVLLVQRGPTKMAIALWKIKFIWEYFKYAQFLMKILGSVYAVQRI